MYTGLTKKPAGVAGLRQGVSAAATLLILLATLAGMLAVTASAGSPEPGASLTESEPGSKITASEPAPEPASVSPLEPAAVSVDFGAGQGDLLRTERLNTWDNGDPVPDLRPDDAEFLNEQGLHSEIVRIGFAVDGLCDVAADTCDFSSIDDWIDDISDATDSLVVHLTPEHIIEEKRPPAEARPLLKLVIKELKQRFPKIDFIESPNEPDWIFHGAQIYAGRKPILQPEEVYDYYVPFYQAVNEVNEELLPSERIMVGGPTLTGLSETWMKAFLDGYAADPNPDKRLDFISYHGYGVFSDDFKEYHAYKADPSQVSTERARLDKWLEARDITRYIPALVTETGIYPGPSFDEPDPSKADYIRQAAGLASLHYWWAGQPRMYPFNWVVRHATQGRKDQLVTRAPEGPLADTFTPYGNMLLMQSKMKDTRVKATSDSLSKGQGVYAVASKDDSGASVMVWNYQHINNGRFRATIDMSRLPPELSDGPVRRKLYRIDQTTSNYWADPQQANLQQVDERIVTLGKTHTEIVDLEPNAIYLVLLEPDDTEDHRHDQENP